MKKILVFFVCAVMMCLLCACGVNPAYKEATGLYSDGKYLEAAAKFDEAGDYKDSADMAKECRYLYARQMMEAESYEIATDVFQSLGDYKDSADMAKEATYQQGWYLINLENYNVAQQLFARLGDYKDSAQMGDQISKIRHYKEALRLLNKGDADSAYKEFELIKGYEDVDEYLSKFVTLYLPSRLEYRAVTVDNFGDSQTDRYIEHYQYNKAGDLVARYADKSYLDSTSSKIHAWACNPISSIYADGESYEYDENGRLLRIVGLSNAKYVAGSGISGRTNYQADFDYNDAGQIIRENFTTSTDSGYMDLSYDGNGNLSFVQMDPNHGFSISYSYDGSGNVVSEYNSIDFGYSNNYSYVYDENGRITERTVYSSYSDSYVDKITYDESGNPVLVERTFPNMPNKTAETKYYYKNFAFYEG